MAMLGASESPPKVGHTAKKVQPIRTGAKGSHECYIGEPKHRPRAKKLGNSAFPLPSKKAQTPAANGTGGRGIMMDSWYPLGQAGRDMRAGWAFSVPTLMTTTTYWAIAVVNA